MHGTWVWVFIGAAIAVPQALARVLRRRDSRLAGPAASITTLILRTFVGLIQLWLAFRLATGYAVWLLVPAALLGALGVWMLISTSALAVVNGYVAVDRPIPSRQEDLPRLLRRIRSGKQVLVIVFLGGAVLAVTIGVASHYG